MPDGNEGFAPTIAPAEGTEETLASSAGPPRTIIRAGGGADYEGLVEVSGQHYVAQRELARGGMGRIRVARDRRLGRTIAIKELLRSHPDARQRFEREVRITARLQHPAIVSVLEAGTWSDGEPFYTMPLVDGTSLDKVIAARPALEQRLALLPNVIAVVDALAFAHARRIIHRDLKPGNVLVGEFGETLVIDWGLAKDLGDAAEAEAEAAARAPLGRDGETEYGAVLGTPAYMPPEQANGEPLDERADVYALGAVLYHTLAGAPPYTGKTTAAILEAVRAGPPRAISSRADGIPTDLAAIVGKAMAYAAGDRYRTAKELADDLKKFQTGQIVGAHRYTTWQLVRRWVRRHRVAVTVGAVAALVLAVVAGASVRRIVAEQAATERQRREAVANRDGAEELVQFMLTDLRDKLVPIGKQGLLDAVARKVADYYEHHATTSDAERRRRARAFDQLGEIAQLQGDLDRALALVRASLAARQALLAAAPADRARQAEVAASDLRLGALLRAQGEQAAAMEATLAGRTLLAALAATAPDDLAAQRQLAVAHGAVGALARSSAPDVARAALEAAASIAAKLASAPAPTREMLHTAWVAYGDLGDLNAERGDLAGAGDAYRAMHAIAERLAVDPADLASQRVLATSLSRLSELALRRGDLTEALARREASIAIAQRLAANDPSNANLQRDVAVDQIALGDLMATSRAPDAAAAYRRALDGITALVARDPKNADWQRDLAVAHARLGRALLDGGDAEAATAQLEQSVAIKQLLVEAQPGDLAAAFDLARGYEALADAQEDRDDLAAALASTQRAQALLVKLAAQRPPTPVLDGQLADAHDRVGALLLQQGRPAAALAPVRAGLAISERLVRDDATNTSARGTLGYGYFHLGQAQLHLGALAEARAAFEACLAIRAAAAPDDPDAQYELGRTHAELARTLRRQRDLAGARRELAAAVALFARLAPSDAASAAELARLRADVK